MWFYQTTFNESEGDCLSWCHITAAHLNMQIIWGRGRYPYRFPPFTEIGQILKVQKPMRKGTLQSQNPEHFLHGPVQAGAFAVHR